MIVEVYEALRAIDVPDEQAKAAARALSADVTNEVAGLRRDMAAEFAAVRAEMAVQRKEITAEIAAVRMEMATQRKDLSAEIGAVRKDLSAEIAAMRKDVDALRADFAAFKAEFGVVRWIAGTALAILIAIALKLFLA
jgi:uncharacterized protein involved in exopolysaccharide biosynthesis